MTKCCNKNNKMLATNIPSHCVQSKLNPVLVKNGPYFLQCTQVRVNGLSCVQQSCLFVVVVEIVVIHPSVS